MPYTLFSSAFIVMYFSPATRKPPLWIFFTSDVSEYEAMTSFISAGDTWPHRQSSSLALNSSNTLLLRAPSRVLNEYIELVDGRSRNCQRTVKPWDEAQTLVPWVLKMAALSRFPVPTKLRTTQSASERGEDAVASDGT